MSSASWHMRSKYKLLERKGLKKEASWKFNSFFLENENYSIEWLLRCSNDPDFGNYSDDIK